ncbi:MAG TPA: RDD family protein [Opitutales bacterium]|nr:RDD family protein [Opitutales bacterium]
MSRTIFVVTESGAQAQYNPEQVEAMLRAGHLKPDQHYWTEGMSEWRPLQEFLEAPVAVANPPPPSPVAGSDPDEVSEGTLDQVYAVFWRRVIAAFLDGIVVYIAFVIVSFIVGFVGGMLLGNLPEARVRIAGFVIGIVTGWLYFALMESSASQATLGKMAIDLKVTDLEGRRIGFGRASGRHFGKFLSSLTFLIGYLMAAFTRRKQALHDLMADCLVVRD